MKLLLERLKPREKEVLQLRFGMKGKKEKTLEEVGLRLGVTRERVRQIEKKALQKLRVMTKCSSLVEYLDE